MKHSRVAVLVDKMSSTYRLFECWASNSVFQLQGWPINMIYLSIYLIVKQILIEFHLLFTKSWDFYPKCFERSSTQKREPMKLRKEFQAKGRRLTKLSFGFKHLRRRCKAWLKVWRAPNKQHILKAGYLIYFKWKPKLNRLQPITHHACTLKGQPRPFLIRFENCTAKWRQWQDGQTQMYLGSAVTWQGDEETHC